MKLRNEAMKKRSKNEVDSILRNIETDNDEIQYEVYCAAYKLITKGFDFESALSCAKKQFNIQ
jgi:hypothetical protein